jgi:hypothetical protein
MSDTDRLISPDKRGEDVDATCGRNRLMNSPARPRRAPT